MKCSFLSIACSTIFILMPLIFTLTPTFAARPFNTDDAGTVETGKFELETACNYWEKETELGASFKHGITERMDIGVCVGYCMLPTEDRKFTGESIGLKFALIPELLSVSFTSEFGNKSYITNFIMSKSFGPISIDANIGYQAQADINDADLTYGLVAVYEVGRFGIGAEVCGTHETINWWQVGSRFQIVEWLQFDIGLGGDFKKEPDFTATTGLWFTFPLPKQPKTGE